LSFSANILAQNTISVKENKEKTESKIFLYPEKKATYPGGDIEKIKFIKQNINYPQIARETGLSGDVYISFIVEKDGSLNELKIIKGIGSECDEEVLRLYEQMKNWEAAMHNNQKVRSEIIEKVSFTLTDAKNKYYEIPEVKAEFIEGNIALEEYLNNSFGKLSKETNYKYLNKVYAKFIVKKDGSIGETVLLNMPSIKASSEDENFNISFEKVEKDFIHAIQNMPKWKPATLNGKNIESEIIIAYDFSVYDDGSENNLNDEKSELDMDKIFVFTEQHPEFPGGDNARIQYISENVNYPKKAREKGTQGTVYASFIVEKDGSISNVEILRGIGYGCDEEVIRVISSMPNWKPGIQRGKAVRAQFNMPIKFTLDNPGFFQRIKNIFKKK
jgi:TonB family protein